MSICLFTRSVSIYAFITSIGLYAQVSAWELKYENGIQTLQAGHFTEASAVLESAYHEAQSMAAPVKAMSAIGLASAYLEEGRNEEAERSFVEARTILEALKAPADQLAVVWNGIGETLLNRSRIDEGEKAIRQALELLDSAGQVNAVYYLCQRQLAEICLLREDYAQSATLISALIAKLRKTEAGNGALLASALSVHGRALLMQRRATDAVAAIRESAELQRQLGVERPAYADSLLLLSVAYRVTGHTERSQPLARKALKIYEDAGDPRAAFALRELGLLAARDGKTLTAQDYIMKALAMARKGSMPERVTDAFEKDLASVPMMASNRRK